MTDRPVATGVGLLVIGVGIAAVIEPGVAARLPMDRAVVAMVGVLLLVAGLYAIQRWRGASFSRAEPPTPETSVDLPSPGASVDDALAEIDGNFVGTRSERQSIERRLTTVATGVLEAQHGWTTDAAQRALEAGTWTEDPHAAAYFLGWYPEWAPTWLRVRARAPVTRIPLSTQVEHAVDELAAIAAGNRPGLERPDDASDGAPSAAPADADDATPGPGDDQPAATSGGDQ